LCTGIEVANSLFEPSLRLDKPAARIKVAIRGEA
jgi:hypothetical protein